MTVEVDRILWGCYRPGCGHPVHGEVKFTDTVEWEFSARNIDGIYFTVDSGMPSSHSLGTYGRMISPPKRVAALRRHILEVYLAKDSTS